MYINVAVRRVPHRLSYPGMRMKTLLETLQGFEQDPEVRQTLLDVLHTDSNSRVRIEAINLLANSLRQEGGSGTADPQTLSVLRDRLQGRNDPSNYVRRQSAAARCANSAD